MKSRIGGKFFKKLSEQSTGKDKRLHLKIFLGNRGVAILSFQKNCGMN